MPVAGSGGKHIRILAPARSRWNVSEWSEWYVYRVDGPPIGPVAAKAVAEAILAGRLPPDCWVCPARSGARWLRASSVPVIAGVMDAVPTRRRPSGLRMVTAPMPSSPTATSVASATTESAGRLDETIQMPKVPEPSPEPPTLRSGPPRGPDGFPVPPPPPSSSSPTPPSGYREGDTLDSAFEETFEEAPRRKLMGG